MRWFHLLGSLKNLTIGLIWLVTRRGGVGGWAREAGKGESSVGATRRALVPPFGAPLKT